MIEAYKLTSAKMDLYVDKAQWLPYWVRYMSFGRLHKLGLNLNFLRVSPLFGSSNYRSFVVNQITKQPTASICCKPQKIAANDCWNCWIPTYLLWKKFVSLHSMDKVWKKWVTNCGKRVLRTNGNNNSDACHVKS